jgi:hypothetical protein
MESWIVRRLAVGSIARLDLLATSSEESCLLDEDPAATHALDDVIVDGSGASVVINVHLSAAHNLDLVNLIARVRTVCFNRKMQVGY